MDLSCAFAPGPDTSEHIVLAEELGYRRAWVYDSPALYFDMWTTLASAAERTSTIGLASGVAIPALRHVAVTASAALTVNHRALGRFTLGMGAGGTGMMMLGRKSVPWTQVVAYAQAVRVLARGESVQWDGSDVRLAPPWTDIDPLAEFPIVFGVEGPRGEQAARSYADGVFTVFRTPGPGFDWVCRMVFGTVLDPGEPPTSDRAFDAAGAGAAANYHFAYHTGNRELLNSLPGGQEWGAFVDKIDEHHRHRAVWDGHCVRLSDPDRRFIPREAVAAMSCTGTREQIREQIRGLLERGVTEVVFQPSGPDVPRELGAFAHALKGM